MKTLQLKLEQIKAENDKLEAEINSLLSNAGSVRVEVVSQAMKTRTVTVDQISLQDLRKLLDAGFKVVLTK